MNLLLTLLVLHSAGTVQTSGEMRRMFTEGDINPNVSLAQINKAPSVYALGPLAGLKGEITVFDGVTYVSSVGSTGEKVEVVPQSKAVFLVYASVPKWREVTIPEKVANVQQLEAWLGTMFHKPTRTPFLIKASAGEATYHVQNYKGTGKELTHEAHDAAKATFKILKQDIKVLGFFTNIEEDGGKFVHMGQKLHMHVLSGDKKQMGHVETLSLKAGGKLLLPIQE